MFPHVIVTTAQAEAAVKFILEMRTWRGFLNEAQRVQRRGLGHVISKCKRWTESPETHGRKRSRPLPSPTSSDLFSTGLILMKYRNASKPLFYFIYIFQALALKIRISVIDPTLWVESFTVDRSTLSLYSPDL